MADPLSSGSVSFFKTKEGNVDRSRVAATAAVSTLALTVTALSLTILFAPQVMHATSLVAALGHPGTIAVISSSSAIAAGAIVAGGVRVRKAEKTEKEPVKGKEYAVDEVKKLSVDEINGEGFNFLALPKQGLTTDQIRLLSQGCVEQFTPDELNAMTDDQFNAVLLAHIKPETVAQLSEARVRAFLVGKLNAMTPGQFAQINKTHLNPEAFAGLKIEYFLQLQVDQLAETQKEAYITRLLELKKDELSDDQKSTYQERLFALSWDKVSSLPKPQLEDLLKEEYAPENVDNQQGGVGTLLIQASELPNTDSRGQLQLRYTSRLLSVSVDSLSAEAKGSYASKLRDLPFEKLSNAEKMTVKSQLGKCYAGSNKEKEKLFVSVPVFEKFVAPVSFEGWTPLEISAYKDRLLERCNGRLFVLKEDEDSDAIHVSGTFPLDPSDTTSKEVVTVRFNPGEELIENIRKKTEHVFAIDQETRRPQMGDLVLSGEDFVGEPTFPKKKSKTM